MPDDAIHRLLDARGRTHGDFTDHARATQRLKGVIADELGRRHARGQPDLSLCAFETLDMIMHKVGRILAGEWDHPDHWDDISGYARLVAERCSNGAVAAPKSPLGGEFSDRLADK